MKLAPRLRDIAEGRLHKVTALALVPALDDLGRVVEHLRQGLVEYDAAPGGQAVRHAYRQELAGRASDLLAELSEQGLVAPRHGGRADTLDRLVIVARDAMLAAPGEARTLDRVRAAELAAVEAVLVDVGYLGEPAP